MWFGESAPAGILKSAANALAGEKNEDFRKAFKILMDSPGKTINILTTTKKVGEKSYTNLGHYCCTDRPQSIYRLISKMAFALTKL